MTNPSHPAHPPRWGVAAATLVLAAGAVVAWSSVLGTDLVAAAPVALAAALVAAGRMPARWAPALLAAWLPAALVLAGVPGAALKPHNWGLLPGFLGDGWAQLATPERGLVTGDPWPLAAALVAVGALWLSGTAIAAWRRPSPPRDMLAFAALTLPMVVAIALGQSHDGAWQGGIVLAAAMMWLTAGRIAPAVVLGAAVALVATTATAALAPHDRWLAPGSLFHDTPSFRSLDTDQTYGPLSTSRTGATMLEVTSSRPALWRMRVLDKFDGSGWVTGVDGLDLPQPATAIRTTTVRVAKLRNDLLVAPGQITAVAVARGRSLPATGEARRLARTPQRGETYRVRSAVVEATPAQLRGAPAPDEDILNRYTFAQLRALGARFQRSQYEGYVGNGDGYGNGDGRPGGALDPPRYDPGGRPAYPPQWGVWGQVAEIADRLAAGAQSQFDIVARVQRYLQSDRFHYTTDVPAAGDQPLIDFLLTTHRGYCQHFAGAAALLLRMAGVPTRVAVGFATGEETSPGHYRVRDQDAHAWIEVYFRGYGWVPFNPTPAAAAAVVPAGLDLVNPAAAAPAPPAGGGDGAWPAIAAVAVVAGTGVLLLRRRRGHPAARDLPDALERVAPRVGIPLRPDHTFVQLRQELLAHALPRTAALAGEAAQNRYAAEPPAPTAGRHPTARVWAAVIRDLGVWRAVTALLAGRAPRPAAGP